MDIFRVIRVTWLPRNRPEQDGRAAEPPAREKPGQETPAEEKTAEEKTAEEKPAANGALTAEDVAPTAGGTPATKETGAVEPPPDMIRDLIGLSDDLQALTGKAPGAEPSSRTLQLLQRRVDGLLNACGVQILGEDGPVVASRHEVVGLWPAGADDTEGWIASTVRRGYLHGDRLIRPQQVMAYTAGSPAGTEGRNGDEE
jgi:hypothetical protein